jgi:hypothetical protein
MNMFIEAIIIGLCLIPLYWATEKVLGDYGKWVVVFISGALFHLIAEFTGMNQAYINSKKRI